MRYFCVIKTKNMAYNTTLTVNTTTGGSITIDPIRFMNINQANETSLNFSNSFGIIGRKFKAGETPDIGEDQYTVSFAESAINADPAWGEWFARQILTALSAPPWVANVVATAPPSSATNIVIS
jgi:hypothetical protein